MQKNKLAQLIAQLENYVECWKQFCRYLNLARTKKFTAEDDAQFLEIKSVMTQELELIMAAIESGAPAKEDIHGLISAAPSLRYVSEMSDGSWRGLENQWHRIFIAWQSILGQLKVRQRQMQSQSVWGKLTGRGKG